MVQRLYRYSLTCARHGVKKASHPSVTVRNHESFYLLTITFLLLLTKLKKKKKDFFFVKLNPAGTQRCNDIVLKSMRCDDVTSTSIGRHFDVLFLLRNKCLVK